MNEKFDIQTYSKLRAEVSKRHQTAEEGLKSFKAARDYLIDCGDKGEKYGHLDVLMMDAIDCTSIISVYHPIKRSLLSYMPFTNENKRFKDNKREKERDIQFIEGLTKLVFQAQ